MPIVLPNTDQIPDGPHRRLLLAVHQLYRDAGKPGIHHTSRTIRSRNDLRDTISHEAISRILRGEVMPRRWQKLEALIQQYLDWSVDRPSPRKAPWRYARFKRSGTKPPTPQTRLPPPPP
ncbi:hypothetical protein SVIO_111750 [Streptomyces violaceusniger]|uniref:Uncharacterized protein n=1 Tax=Streptomyces violaceusniger TaxID=68280 RepID=A0A4D4LGW1_STRVO|nr:hypothetical protein SVIO_111750 [Streptomyces violaceusniger]